LRVVSGRAADHALRERTRVELRDLVVGAAQLERENRLLVLAFQPDLVAEAARQARRVVERGLERDVVDARLEDPFDVAGGERAAFLGGRAHEAASLAHLARAPQSAARGCRRAAVRMAVTRRLPSRPRGGDSPFDA